MDITSVSGASASPRLRLVGSEVANVTESADHAVMGGNSLPHAVSESTSQKSVEQAVSRLEAFTQSISRNLSFKLDDSTGRVVVKVTDAASGEVIRQIPSEEVLKLAASLEDARSLLFKAEA